MMPGGAAIPRRATGGTIVAQGTPEEIARSEASHTGRFLREVLARRPVGGGASAGEGAPDAKPDRKARAKGVVRQAAE